ncbi:MAG TPA: alpha/beta fold hydrolase [Steroidobacteraceae bacterium]|nr:alpha/beta fold hydrolase [Steroidobacteraceae bacterium]
MSTNEFYCHGADGGRLYVRSWLPAEPRALVVISHGAAEHGARYERFAKLLVARGIGCYAPDHRGHGRTAESLVAAGNAGIDGFNGMIRDLRVVIDLARSHAAVPLMLLGHSMGAAMAQRFVQIHGDVLQGLILSGSPGLRPNLEKSAAAAASAATGDNGDVHSVEFAKSFATFNEGFEAFPGQSQRTGYEWLSRDANEVRTYVEDPWCGFPFTNRLVAEMAACALEASQPENMCRIPKALPILFIAGAHDRVGGNGAFVEGLAMKYRETGIADVRVLLYASGRHEMLNEKNRDIVQRDIVDWLESRT